MHAPANRLVRLGLILAGAAGASLLGGCSVHAATAPSPAPAPTTAVAPVGVGTGSDGLTVRYLDHGTVKTLRVEDFPR